MSRMRKFVSENKISSFTIYFELTIHSSENFTNLKFELVISDLCPTTSANNNAQKESPKA